MLVQVVGSEVVDRGEGIGHGDNRVSDGQRLGGNSHRRRSGRTDRRGGHEVGREGVLGIVHEVLDELEILGLELLTRSLETIDLLELGLLFGQSLADNLAGLASASLRIRSAFSLASLTMVSAVCWAAIRAAEIWRS